MRVSQRAAARKAAFKLRDAADATDEEPAPAYEPSPSPSRSPSPSVSPAPRPSRRRKMTKAAPTLPTQTLPTSITPRLHSPSYHHPLALSSPLSRAALLTWFADVHDARAMPWRKPWVDPSAFSSDASRRAALAQRAYEVWISEIMLQQTRVASVIGYWTRWMARWPSIFDLARAEADDVVAAWQGLGYYSRARRVLEAARMVVDDPDMQGLLPSDVSVLVNKVSGVGRYTAGAIAAIVFGKAEAMVDGNVLRVLSRQTGLLGDVKEKGVVVETLWRAADELVKVVAEGEELSDRPGKWGQALMELGSTICTPKPNCAACPITETCRAYQEGYALAAGREAIAKLDDVEGFCSLCSPLEEAVGAEEDEPTEANGKAGTKRSQQELSAFFLGPNGKPKNKNAQRTTTDARTLEIIANHARKFPLRKPKKKVREEETLVCTVRRTSDGAYLIHRRPEKGLLAGLWEFPSHRLPPSNDSTAELRKASALEYVAGLADLAGTEGQTAIGKRKRTGLGVKHLGELGSVPWLFSHLKLTMHVHLFEFDGKARLLEGPRSKWVPHDEVDQESMGTGMRKCWALVKEQG